MQALGLLQRTAQVRQPPYGFHICRAVTGQYLALFREHLLHFGGVAQQVDDCPGQLPDGCLVAGVLAVPGSSARPWPVAAPGTDGRG
jgi:hypothetical protein